MALQTYIVTNKRPGAIKLPAAYGNINKKVLIKPGRNEIEYDFDGLRKDPKKVAIVDVFDAHCTVLDKTETRIFKPEPKNTSKTKDNVFQGTVVDEAIAAIREMSLDECKKCQGMDTRREINQALKERIADLEDEEAKKNGGVGPYFGSKG